MIRKDDILNVNFDVTKLSTDELNEARAIIREQLVLFEKKRFEAEKKGLDTTDLYKKIRHLDQVLTKVRVQMLLREDS